MEAWITVLVAAIVALSTLGATWLQNRHSQKRFEKELERQREIDSGKRKQVVRDSPLLNLREELAHLATKNDRMISFAVRFTIFRTMKTNDFTEEQKNKLIQKAITEGKQALEEIQNYSAAGSFEKVLYALDDQEILDRVDQLKGELAETTATITLIFLELRQVAPQAKFPSKRFDKLLKATKGIKSRVKEIQSLINKRLEEL